MTAAPKTRVLFVCTHNSARSIMAEGLLRHIGGERYEVYSGGTHPGTVQPLALRVLADAGIDTGWAASKSLEPFLDLPFDYVITLCDDARQACPNFPGDGESMHWGYTDPSKADGDEAARLAAYQKVFTALASRIRQFIQVTERQAGPAEAARPA